VYLFCGKFVVLVSSFTAEAFVFQMYTIRSLFVNLVESFYKENRVNIVVFSCVCL